MEQHQKFCGDNARLKDANIICEAAYIKIMRMAKEINSWIPVEPVTKLAESKMGLFGEPFRPGRKMEVSMEKDIVPCFISVLLDLMTEVDEWAKSFPHIVIVSSDEDVPYLLKQLPLVNSNIRGLRMIYAEYALPILSQRRRAFYFLRFVKKICKDAYAIIDVSSNLFPNICQQKLEKKCQRKASGVILRKIGRLNNQLFTEVTWIENVEVNETAKNSIFSSITDSNFAFGARRWVSTLQWKLSCDRCKFVHHGMALQDNANEVLLNLSSALKMKYFHFIKSPTERPPGSVLHRVEGQLIVRFGTSDSENFNLYAVVVSFLVNFKTLRVFEVLSEQNKWHKFTTPKDTKEEGMLIKFASPNDKCSFGVWKRWGKDPLFMEASKDEYCSFLITCPIPRKVVDRLALSGREINTVGGLRPSICTIMPAGEDGFQSNSCVVTSHTFHEFDKARELDERFKSDLLHQIRQAIVSKINAESGFSGSD